MPATLFVSQYGLEMSALTVFGKPHPNRLFNGENGVPETRFFRPNRAFKMQLVYCHRGGFQMT